MPPGEYDWDGKTVVMTKDGMLQYPEQQVLAGASFPVRTGVMNMVNLAGIELENAVKMATATTSKIYNLDDRGKLEMGKSADLILFTIEEGQIVVQKTVVQGKVVYSR
jgi:N-acetylglucosamine-6-phosphate deacetylase